MAMITTRNLLGGSVSHPQQAAVTAALAGRSILLADDSMVIRFIVGVALGAQGAVVYEAGNGEEAVALALQIRPDIILMDMQMPLLDGPEATVQLRSGGLQDTKIIALTGASSPAEQTLCISAGMDGIIEKPFSPAMLIAKLLAVLNGQGAEAAAETRRPTSVNDEVLSLELLHEYWGGNPIYTERMLRIAERELPDAAREMKAALAIGDPGGISRLAHRVRPCVEGLRLSGMAATLLRLELLAEEVLRFDELELMVKNVSADLHRLARQIGDGIPGMQYGLA